MDMNYSVLMSVYYKENPIYLKAAVESILAQTIKTNDFVIVCDGPLGEELDRVIDDFCQRYPGLFHIVRLEKNVGLAMALNAGIDQCSNELIARMDSDDISLPFRMEMQLQVIKNTGADVVSGTVQEFSGSMTGVGEIEADPNVRGVLRVLPKDHEDIMKFAKKRSPFNHPAVMYKKSIVESCGKYVHYPYFEDYNLWVTMLQEGSIGYNINEVVVYMRAGDDMYKRRGGLAYTKHIAKFKKHLKDTGFINTRQYLIGVIGHAAVGIMPNGMRKFLYAKVLRKESE